MIENSSNNNSDQNRPESKEVRTFQDFIIEPTESGNNCSPQSSNSQEINNTSNYEQNFHTLAEVGKYIDNFSFTTTKILITGIQAILINRDRTIQEIHTLITNQNIEIELQQSSTNSMT